MLLVWGLIDPRVESIRMNKECSVYDRSVVKPNAKVKIIMSFDSVQDFGLATASVNSEYADTWYVSRTFSLFYFLFRGYEFERHTLCTLSR